MIVPRLGQHVRVTSKPYFTGWTGVIIELGANGGVTVRFDDYPPDRPDAYCGFSFGDLELV